MTLIANGNDNYALQGSPDKRMAMDANGIMWTLLVAAGATNGHAKFFWSADGGNSWTYAANSDISLGQARALPSFYIDQYGFAHVCFIQYGQDPQVVIYSRGSMQVSSETLGVYNSPRQKVTFYQRDWNWKRLSVYTASGRAYLDSDVVAFRKGSGYVAFICYSTQIGGTGGGVQMAQVNISSSGSLSIASTSMGPTANLEASQFGSLEFNHTGDGKTPSATPDLYMGTGLFGSSGGVRLYRGVWASPGVWTFGTPVTLDTGNVTRSAMCGVWDGSVFVFAYSLGTSAISCYTWDGVNAPVSIAPPAAPSGTGVIQGLNLSIDPVTRDVFLAWYDGSDGDIRWSRYTRTTTTWAAWADAVVRAPDSYDGKVQLMRHPTRNTIDMVYGINTNPGHDTSWAISSLQLAVLVRTPPAPTLLSPVGGAKVNLALGAVFTWAYNGVALGDSQSAYVFKRVNGATTQYWNASTQAWQSGTVTNVDTNNQVVFPAGVWTSGTTYTWSVAATSATGTASAFSATQTVVATAAPVVVVTAPVSIIYGESTPIVTWTYTGTSAQRDYQVKIYTDSVSDDPTSATNLVWDSGVVASSTARATRIGLALANYGTYRAYVQCNSIDPVASGWSYQQFSISIIPPNGPSVEVVDSIDYVSNIPRARLDLMGQSSFLTSDQDAGVATGWEVDVNATFVQQLAAPDSQLLAGLKVTRVAAGLVGVRTAVGSPPAAPSGEVQPTSPLSFPVVPTVPYSLVASFKSASATGRTGRVRIRWYDDDDGTGTLISESVGASVVITTTAYTQAFLTASAPANAVLGRAVLEIVGPTAASEIYYTAMVSLAPGRSTVYQPGGYSTIATLRVERSDDGGTTWNTVIQKVKPTLNQQAIAYDRTMPFGIDTIYQAYTDVDQGAGSTLSSGVSPTATINISADRWAIRDTGDDEGEYYAYVTGHDQSDDESSSVHRPFGRYYPVVDTEGLQAATGTLHVWVPAGDITFATAVLDRTSVFVVQSPIGMVMYVRILTRTYNVDNLRHRIIDCAYVEVEPVVPSQ